MVHHTPCAPLPILLSKFQSLRVAKFSCRQERLLVMSSRGSASVGVFGKIYHVSDVENVCIPRLSSSTCRVWYINEIIPSIYFGSVQFQTFMISSNIVFETEFLYQSDICHFVSFYYLHSSVIICPDRSAIYWRIPCTLDSIFNHSFIEFDCSHFDWFDKV